MQSFSKILSTVRDFYNEINPATLTGAIDVLVIEQPDGCYVSSPFYVRFGKMGVLRSREKIVDITINDQNVSGVFMKLGDTGEAFFLERNNDPAGHFELAENGSSHTGLKARAASTSSSFGEAPTGRPLRRSASPKRVRWLTSTSVPQQSSHLLRRSVSEVSAQALTFSFLLCNSNFKSCLCVNASQQPNDLKISKYLEVPISLPPPSLPICGSSEAEKSSRDAFAGDATLSQEDMDNLERVKREGAALGKVLNDASDWKYERHFADQTTSTRWRFWHLGSLIRGGTTNQESGGDQDAVYLNDLEAMTPSLANKYVLDISAQPTTTAVDEQQPEEPLPLSPRSVDDAGYSSHPDSDSGFENLRPPASSSRPPTVRLALCSDDCGETLTTEEFQRRQLAYEDLAADPSILQRPNLVIRLGDRLYRGQSGIAQIVSLAAFNKVLVTSNAKSVDLVTSDASLRPLPPFRRRSASGSIGQPFSQHRLQDRADLASGLAPMRCPTRSALSDSELEDAATREDRRQCNPTKSRYKRTLRLDSTQLKSLPLVAGVNKARFSVTTKYQGTCWCECHIFLWKWDDKLVISDIDGTITKSDVLGHILPIMGAQWVQAGVAELLNQIVENGYRIVYLSARAIGQSQWTKDYLRWVKQDKLSLPQGPLLLSPTSLMIALHREVIEKKPEVFKTGCLMEIRNLFPQTANPFYAGLGNRHNDVIAYTAVGIPRHRIFCINSSGAVECALKLSSLTYRHLTDLADHFFPPLKRTNSDGILQPDFYEPISYSSYNFWKPILPELTVEELEKYSSASKTSDA